MSAAIKSHLAELFAHALAQIAPQQSAALVEIERPKQAQHGDWACNLAMQLARLEKKKPRELAEALIAALPASEWVEKVDIAGPGFINIHIRLAAKLAVIGSILSQGTQFGRVPASGGQRVLVEFVSANPTGPLHVGHGRQAALGDAICALLETQGLRVSREFYYNDAGSQIDNLALSVQARARGIAPDAPQFPADGYRGDYIREIAADYLARKTVSGEKVPAVTASGDSGDLDAIRRFAVAYLRNEQDIDLKAFGVRFDTYYLESSLYSEGRVDDTVAALKSSGETYEQDGALWLKTTDYGDDKDRVMRKSDGAYTYFVPDVAYHISKWERGFARAINIQGSDHHSTVVRVRAGLQAAKRHIPVGYPDYVLHKMVTVMKGGEEVKISKRAGSYVTLRDLIDEVGRDATRFFLVSRKADTEFVFDIDLAKSQSEENPVYYVQYAHARLCSVLAQAGGSAPGHADADLSVLESPRELALLARLGDYPAALAHAAAELSPHLVSFYLRELAGDFHSYYNAERILVDDARLKHARIALAAAVKQVLGNGLALLGVSAPEKM
ncbi:MAG: arginine--tRNA ligase [Betaproteobacteria bacterium]